MNNTNLLDATHKYLLWPEKNQIFNPIGAGPRVLQQLACDKIIKTLKLEFSETSDSKIGILTANPEGDETEAPIAIICEFLKPVSREALNRIIKLSWSFSRTPALITIEPHLLRVWSCCVIPQDKDNESVLELKQNDFINYPDNKESNHGLAEALTWIELTSGRFFNKFEAKFQKKQAADTTLLNNLRFVKRKLASEGLNESIIHDLLARLMFIQLLFDRKDSKGNSALNEQFLNKLFKQRILNNSYESFSDLLLNHSDTYRFFKLLNERFNGDLFPGKDENITIKNKEWDNEEKQVKEKHLSILSEFIRGDLILEDGQLSLWPLYSFDALPLEFVSSIYEEFISKDENNLAHYTPNHIVDLILDSELPWNNKNYNVKVFDPSCGSGIFLVKAFQRLIYRWKLCNPHTEILASTVKSLLENNIFGTDINPQAVRVASFSLYLAMCDAIDPKYYWRSLKFPKIRGKNIKCKDFFDTDYSEDIKNSDKFDLILGNAPWGRNTATLKSIEWSENNDWNLTYGNIGPLFLVKSASLLRPNGQIAMMLPANILLYSPKLYHFRNKLFSKYEINQVVNLSALRFGLFKNSISPSCIVSLKNSPPTGNSFPYICPKPVYSTVDDFKINIELDTINFILPYEAISDPFVWTAFLWGNRRDLRLIHRLSKYDSLLSFEKKGLIKKRQGIIRTDRKKRQELIVGRHILETKKFPSNELFVLNAKELPINQDPLTHSRDSTDYSAFKMPQLILKQSFQQDLLRFQARKIEHNKLEGILCSTGYVSIHSDKENASIIENACLTYNSILSVYYLLLTSGTFASYRPKIHLEELLKVPLPRNDFVNEIENYSDVDLQIKKCYKLKDSEWILIEDLYKYTLSDFKHGKSSKGRLSTVNDIHDEDELILKNYCKFFFRVIRAGFGKNKGISAQIINPPNIKSYPFRLVAIFLNHRIEGDIETKIIKDNTLLKKLTNLNKIFAETNQGRINYQKCARIYTTSKINGKIVPTIYLLKPDMQKYWSRSTALADADAVYSDIIAQ